jgi:hypothetical protein
MNKQFYSRLISVVLSSAGLVILTAFSTSMPAAASPGEQNPGTAKWRASSNISARFSPSTPLPASHVAAAMNADATELPSVTPTYAQPATYPYPYPYPYPYSRIAFALGTTSGSVGGTLASQTVQSYVLTAMWNQVMMVTASSSSSAVYLQIYGAYDGRYLAVFSSALASWQGRLPRTQDYVIQVYNAGSAATSYTLAVVIPARIQFARGAYSATIYGAGYAAQVISYVLWARGGQTMTVSLSSSTNSVVMAIHGFGTNQYLVNSSAGDTTWTGTLPDTQDYILEAVQSGAWVGYTLTVTIV